ncbi:MAG: SIMPL domain-containing protein [Ignavibacteriales bacterium]|nr:SIMPL domain-containing protein [Ignavibacteriales bacterium]
MAHEEEGFIKRLTTDYIKLIGIGLIVIIAVTIIARAFVNRNKAQELISVTGIGTVNFEADLAVCSGDFRRVDMNLQNAYKLLNEDRKVVEDYLKKKGVDNKEITFSSISINKEFQHIKENNTERDVFSGFQLSQSVRIESKNVDRVETVAREITEIINRGVEFYSMPPSYFYTKLDEVKLSVISEATKNARMRAESIAKNSNGGLGDLKNATLGVFQITAQNSDESLSWSGSYNTGSKKKTATTTVRLQYSVD